MGFGRRLVERGLESVLLGATNDALDISHQGQLLGMADHLTFTILGILGVMLHAFVFHCFREI